MASYNFLHCLLCWCVNLLHNFPTNQMFQRHICVAIFLTAFLLFLHSQLYFIILSFFSAYIFFYSPNGFRGRKIVYHILFMFYQM